MYLRKNGETKSVDIKNYYYFLKKIGWGWICKMVYLKRYCKKLKKTSLEQLGPKIYI